MAAAPVSLVRIDLTRLSQHELQQLQSLDIDIAFVDRANSRMDALISDQTAMWLTEHGAAFTSLITDVNTYAAQLRQSGYFDHFRSYPQMVSEMQEIVASHPQLASMQDIGDSYLKWAGRGGHDVWALKISDDVTTEDSSEAEVLYMSNIHAREIITPEVLFYFIHYLIDNYGRDAQVTHLIQNRELWFIPSANPDGHEYVFQGDPDQRDWYSMTDPLWWRKNMRDNNHDGQFKPFDDGVDLNRNFGFAWGLDNDGSSPSEGSETYRGPAAFSEPESQIIRDFVKSKNFIISLSYHSYGKLWLYPWGYTHDPLPARDAAVFQTLADSCTVHNNYQPQTGAELYLTNGDTDDWFYGECGIYAFTPEVGDADVDGFHPDTTRILPLIEENLPANLYVARVAGEEPIVHYEKLPATLKQQPFFDLEMTIKKPLVLTDSVDLDPASFRVYYRPENDFHFSVAPVQPDDSTGNYMAEIPGDKMHGKVYYYAEAFDKLGRRGTLPLGAPMAVDSIYVQYPTEVSHQARQPQFFHLVQNYPNPFNSSTTISFNTGRSARLSLTIFDLCGRRIQRLANQDYDGGGHTVVWDGKNNLGEDAPSGFYICRLAGDQQEQSIKILLLR